MKVKKNVILISIYLLVILITLTHAQQITTSPDEVLSIMKEVAGWQLDNPVRFDITVESNGGNEQYSILWDGTFVRQRGKELRTDQYEVRSVGWRYLGHLAASPLAFSSLPTPVKQTFTGRLNLDPESIVEIEMCDQDTKGWEMGAFYVGLEALAEISDDQKYVDVLRLIGEANDWKLGDRIYHADDHCVGQMYLYLYKIYEKVDMLANVQMQFDWIIENPHPQSLNYSEGKNRWSWCDALFMSPPAWLLLSNITGVDKYLDYMNRRWWLTIDHLYDKEEHLFYRDDRYYDRREANNEKVFWSRGNGWVLAGLARIIQNLPDDFSDRDKFITLYKEMMHRIKEIQPGDGMFRASLLDPDSYPVKESSGTAFFIYAAAWGINNGFLSADEYLPFVAKSWNGLLECVNKEGKLGWTQLPGSEPGDVENEYNAPYGAGAFLLAGSEIYKLLIT